MKNIRFLSAIIAVCVMMSMLVGCGSKDALAIVNGEKITKEDYAMYLLTVEYSMMSQAGVASEDQAHIFWKTTEIEGKSAIDIAKERAMEQAVLTKVLCHKAKEIGISLTDEEKAEINQQIDAEITNIGGRVKFEERLTEIGANVEAYTKFMETEVLVNKFMEAVYSMPEYVVTEDQAKDHIKSTYIRAKHILLTTMDESGQPYSDEEKKAVKAQIDDLYQQISNGADFDKLMTTYSQDPGLLTSPDGYVFGKGQMVPEFESTAYALEIGQVSEPVETSYGYHIIKREEVTITDADVDSYLDMELQILQSQKLEQAYEQWKSAADIKINQENLAKVELATMKNR